MVGNAPEIRIENLNKIYGSHEEAVTAVKNVSMTLAPGSFTALVGYSGCGKTTLLRLLAGLEKPCSGSVCVYPDHTYPAVMFQNPCLLPWMTVRRNLLVALRHRLDWKHNKKEIGQRVNAALERVGLRDREKAFPHELSGGMAQRASLARALCQESGFLLMDEPFSSLDALTRAKLQKDLKGIWYKKKCTILFITHDISEALFLAKRILIMNNGCITADLTADTLNQYDDAKAVILSLMNGKTRKNEN
ncbi:ABC-type transporter, ATP-binding protein (ATPase) [Desulforapulum autotrophicum HRM2]|uniref:ABC-type transporter, ATP-binding protein (ATPase) n=1 Tax=Desulforapulum autotrophicum (strain ATCC 43914 / DSM 3382 / VKM B-1955 / HRM2) TaxID=177437 RepID=C0QEF9_DESAH|nr:ABC transporter ATP-binding protein [Desulforapulum autotrophicum]ACN13276.1 ABC-type transporter, ATP-binding protein (ATPase) [Desulforapulum autotrophicum HRM2]